MREFFPHTNQFSKSPDTSLVSYSSFQFWHWLPRVSVIFHRFKSSVPKTAFTSITSIGVPKVPTGLSDLVGNQELLQPPSPRFNSLLAWRRELRETVYLCLLVCRKDTTQEEPNGSVAWTGFGVAVGVQEASMPPSQHSMCSAAQKFSKPCSLGLYGDVLRKHAITGRWWLAQPPAPLPSPEVQGVESWKFQSSYYVSVFLLTSPQSEASYLSHWIQVRPSPLQRFQGF